MYKPDTLSVIVVTYNSADVIQGCLGQLAALHSGNYELEIIVLDNASTDDTVSIIQRDFPDVMLIRSDENTGYGGGNNQAVAASHGELVLILNPDLLLTTNALRNLVSTLQRTPDAAMVGPRTRDTDGTIVVTAYPRFSVQHVLSKYFGLDRFSKAVVYGDYAEKVQTASEPFEAAWLQGACLLLRRELYDQLGGFDEQFFLFCEDADLGERIRREHGKVWYVPNAEVTHYGSSSVAKARLVSERAYHISPLVYFRKRNQPRAVLMLKVGFTVELMIKLLRRQFSRDTDEVAIYRQVLRDVWRF